MLATLLGQFLGVGARRRVLIRRVLQQQQAPDCLASLLTVVVFLAVCPVLESPLASVATWQALSSAVVCPLGWLLLQDRYDRWRSLLACLARLQLLQAASSLRRHANHHLSSISNSAISDSSDPGWLAFGWQLLWESFASTQLWAALAYWLPLRQHVPLALFTAAHALGEFPSKCPPPLPTDRRSAVPLAGYLRWLSFLWYGGSSPGAGPAGTCGQQGACTAAFFRRDAAKVRTLACWLDSPFTFFFKGQHLGDIHPLGDTALCLAIMAWTHLTVGLLASCLLSYALGHASGPKAATSASTTAAPTPAIAAPAPAPSTATPASATAATAPTPSTAIPCPAPTSHPTSAAEGRLAPLPPGFATHGDQQLLLQQQQQQQASVGQEPGPSRAGPECSRTESPASCSMGHRDSQQARECLGSCSGGSGSGSGSREGSACAVQAAAAAAAAAAAKPAGSNSGLAFTLTSVPLSVLAVTRGIQLPRMTAWDVAGAAVAIASIMWPLLRMACLARTPASDF